VINVSFNEGEEANNRRFKNNIEEKKKTQNLIERKQVNEGNAVQGYSRKASHFPYHNKALGWF
jgi:hypothetical protein